MTGELKIKSVVRENLDTLSSMLNEYGDFIETRNISDASDSIEEILELDENSDLCWFLPFITNNNLYVHKQRYKPKTTHCVKIKHRYILEQYDLGHKWIQDKHSQNWHKTAKTEPTDPQILFLELCVNLLNEGGKMCIVLPESVLGNPTQKYVRQWLLENGISRFGIHHF